MRLQPRRRRSPVAPPSRPGLALLPDEDTLAEPPNALAVPLRQELRRGAAPPRERVLRWLRAGFALDGQDHDGATALMCAAEAGGLELTAWLIGRGARVNATDRRGYTALARALRAGHGHVARFLRSRGASPHAVAPLLDAARRGELALLESLLAHGASAQLRDRAGNTALHCAAAHRQRATARALLANGGDPRARNGRGETPLCHAARQRDWRLWALLDGGGGGPLRAWAAHVLRRRAAAGGSAPPPHPASGR